MQENSLQQPGTYEVKRQQKLEELAKTARERLRKRIAKISVVVLAIGGSVGALVWYGATRPPIPESDILSRGGIHWHPQLSIFIQGEAQEISPNIGIGIRHESVHTHDTSGTLHVEIVGLVRKQDTTLGRFFRIWGKQFNANCVFEFCNGPDGTVHLIVNGQENKEFEHYPMKDKDKIEIRYP